MVDMVHSVFSRTVRRLAGPAAALSMEERDGAGVCAASALGGNPVKVAGEAAREATKAAREAAKAGKSPGFDKGTTPESLRSLQRAALSLPSRPRLWASVLSADFANLHDDVVNMDAAGIDGFHVDIMDGHFVPNLSFGAHMVKVVRAATQLPVDVHLMVTCLDLLVASVLPHGPVCVHAHVEADPHLHRRLQSIKDGGAGASLALNPQTAAVAVEDLLPSCDAVLVMTVNPGFGGQTPIMNMTHKVARLRSLGFAGPIMVDGGIDPSVIKAFWQAGASDFVVGTSAFRGGVKQFAANIAALRSAVKDPMGGIPAKSTHSTHSAHPKHPKHPTHPVKPAILTKRGRES